jgi:4-amino-4-deoxy-L-arabinose transferase-like glycosyltransferase
VRAVYKWVATLALVAIVVQVGFAGYGAFYAANKVDEGSKVVTSDQFDTGFGPHFFGALAVILFVLVLLIVGIAAGIGKWRLGRHGVLALLLVLQILLAGLGFAVPAIGFFHPVNALVIFAVAAWIVRDEWRGAPAPAAAAASA